MGAAVIETRAALADGDHYWELAGKLRELARQTLSRGFAASWSISPGATTATAIMLTAGNGRTF